MKTTTAIPLTSRFLAATALAVVALIPFAPARAATWTNLVGGVASGDWGTAANWNTNTVPNATDAVADFSTLDLTADSTVTLGSPVTVGAMLFGDTSPSHNWIVSGSAITNATSAGIPTNIVNNQQVTFNNNVNGSLKKLGAGTLTLAGSGNVLYNGFAANGGTLRITGTVTSSGGRVYVGSANLADAYGITGANGTLVIEPGASLTISGIGADTFVIGRDAGVGTVTQNGGTFNYSAAGKDYLVGAGGGAGTCATNTLNGGTLNLNANQLAVGNYSSTGVFNLNGGTLSVRNVTRVSGGTGTFNFDGGTLQATASRTDFFQTLSAANVKAGGAKIDCNGFNIAVAQSLLAGVGGGGLTKSGNGTLTLSGINTYTGATAVVAGGLVGATGGSCANSALTIASGATNGVQVLTSGGQWVCSNLTYSAGTTILDFDFTTAAPSAAVAPLQVNGNLTLNSTFSFLVRNGSWASSGTYPLVSYTGALSGSVPGSAWVLPAGVIATLVNNTGSKRIDLSVTGVPGVTWDGTTNDWNTAHWLPGNVVGPTTGAGKVTITNGTVSFQGADLFGNWSTTVSPAIALNGGILKSKGNFNTLWNLQMGGGILLADGGTHSTAQAFQLAGTLTVINTNGSTAPSFINVASSPINGYNAVNVGGQGDTALTMNIADVTGDAAADLTVNTVLENSGPMGALPLVKTGAGTLALTAANIYSGGTRINAGTVAISNNAAFGTASVAIASNCTVTALASLSVANACVLSNGVANPFDVGAGRTLTLSGTLSGPGSLTKANAGTLTLSGINTYSGNTAVNAGALVGVTGGSCSNSAVSLAATSGNSAALGVSITDNTKQWTCPSLTVNNAGTGCTLDFNFSRLQPSASVAPLRVIGSAAFTTTPAVTVELSGATGAAGSQYPLMTWGSTSGTPPTALTVTAPRAVTAHLTVSGSTLYLVIDTTAEPLRWATSPSGTWDTGAANWKDNAGAAATYAETNGIGDLVVFDEKYITADTTVTLNSTVSPPNVTVSNTTYNYTLSGSGAIAGSTILTKLGAGTLTLAAAGTHNSFQVNGGSVVVSTNLTINGVNGTFYVGNGGNLGGVANCSGALTINAGAALVMTGTFADNAVIGRDSGSGSVVQNGGLFRVAVGALYIGATGARASYAMNGGTLDMGNNTLGICLAFGGSLTGALNQAGGVITNVNTLQAGSLGTYGTGLYTLSGGRIVVGAGGITSQSGKYQLNLGGGTLGSSASWASSLNMNLTNLNGSVTFDAAANMTNTLSGALSGNGGLSKAGAGTLILSGTNTYAGATAVSNGTLLLNGSITNCMATVGTGATFGGTGTLRWQAGQTITVSGTLNISQLNLALGTAGRVPNGDWTVVDYQNGTLTGASFASVPGLPPYAKLIYDTTAKKIILKMRSGGTLIRVM